MNMPQIRLRLLIHHFLICHSGNAAFSCANTSARLFSGFKMGSCNNSYTWSHPSYSYTKERNPAAQIIDLEIGNIITCHIQRCVVSLNNQMKQLLREGIRYILLQWKHKRAAYNANTGTLKQHRIEMIRKSVKLFLAGTILVTTHETLQGMKWLNHLRERYIQHWKWHEDLEQQRKSQFDQRSSNVQGNQPILH